MTGSLAICLACLTTACGSVPASASPSVVATPAQIPRFELSVSDALTYFEQFSMECIGPERPFPDSREWLCLQDRATSTNSVRIVGDTLGVSELVGVSERETPDGTISFLLGVVVAAVAPLPQGNGMLFAAASHPRRAGAWSLDGASIELRPHSNARAVVVTPPDRHVSR